MNETQKNQLKQNIQNIQETIKEHQVGPAKLVAVTKTVSADVMRAMFQDGLTVFAENRANVFESKLEALSDIKDEIEWHFIGRLQTRPVRKIINDIDYLHSLDRLALVEEIQKRAEKPVKCFLQVNVSGEESKAGIKLEEVDSFIETLQAYDKIHIVGLMTMAPYDADEASLHQQFHALKEKQEAVEAKQLAYAPCHDVSMGMSRDYPIALEEGATVIRVGSAFYEGLDLD